MGMTTRTEATEATEALSFYEQMSDAGARRVAGVARFTAPDGVLDARASTGRRAEGRDEQQRLLTMWFGQTMGEVSLERLYVDADQALALYRQAPRGSASDDSWWMALDTVGDAGIELRLVLISSSGDGEVPDSPTLHEAETLADEHRALWDAGAGAQAAVLYAPDAVLRDTLRDEELVGAGAIAEAVAASEGSWQPMELGLRKVPAVFAHQTSPYSGELTRVVSLVSDGEATMAIDLAVDEDGRVTEERRFHPADALPQPVDGLAVWWSGMTPPPLAADGPATELRSPNGAIEVRGADDVTLDRLRWRSSASPLPGWPCPASRASWSTRTARTATVRPVSPGCLARTQSSPSAPTRRRCARTTRARGFAPTRASPSSTRWPMPGWRTTSATPTGRGSWPRREHRPGPIEVSSGRGAEKKSLPRRCRGA